MTVPITRLQIFRLILQIEQNFNGLQRDFRSNAAMWKGMATDQSQSVAQLAEWMNSAAYSYQQRLSWLGGLQANPAVWTKCAELWTILGGTGEEFDSLYIPFNVVATQLSTVDKSSYAAIISACDLILGYIDAPPSLWPE